MTGTVSQAELDAAAGKTRASQYRCPGCRAPGRGDDGIVVVRHATNCPVAALKAAMAAGRTGR